MSFFCETGVLTSRTSTGTDVVTLTGSGASLTPKLIIFTTNGATATGGANADYLMTFGLSDGTSDCCMSGYSGDNIGTANGQRSMNNDSCIVLVDNVGVTDQATVSATGVGTFTVNWTTKSANALKVGYVAYGGTDMASVENVEFDADGTSGAHTQSVTTTTKSADAGIFLSSDNITVALLNSVYSNVCTSIGMSDGSSNAGMAVFSQFNVPTSNTGRYQLTDHAINRIKRDNGSLLGNGAVSFDATDGIQVAWDSNKTTQQGAVLGFIVKGGRWEVGNGTNKTGTTGTKAFTTAFQPEGLLNFSFNNTSSASVGAQNIINIGASDGSTEFLFHSLDQDGQPTTNCATHFLDDSCRAGADATPSIQYKATLDSFNATDFTLNYTTVEASAAREFIWLVCAADEASGSVFKLPTSGSMDGLGSGGPFFKDGFS